MRRRKRNTCRNQLGANIAEFAGVLMIGGPLVLLLIYLGLECGQFYTIKSAMETSARSAARQLVVKYNTTGNKVTTVDWISVPHFIANSSQFSVTWDSSSPPTYVTVTCSYPSGGAYGLPQFPAGPLKYLSDNSKLSMSSLAPQGTFTLPVQ